MTIVWKKIDRNIPEALKVTCPICGKTTVVIGYQTGAGHYFNKAASVVDCKHFRPYSAKKPTRPCTIDFDNLPYMTWFNTAEK
ncbi:MAG: hypothetical protein HXX08_11190 [Chloroflexi bacterium]|uniref:Uncharacterized protein n=1 Tax=Candidatus Chlorohelix allophototropha TaxID=3003348 RepID=A0A8T7LZB6_9CHLR|nr:hypothetical protein [Chloroflexota bacterium]WJW65801.1 hypothetical protein OZ401_001580 [Chloroflexota bacterium L227-S17]